MDEQLEGKLLRGPPWMTAEDEQLEGELRRGAPWMTAENEPVTVTAASRPNRRGEGVCCVAVAVLVCWGVCCSLSTVLCNAREKQ